MKAIKLFDDFGIRQFRADDASSIVTHANNKNVSRYLRDRFPYPYTLSDAEEWLMVTVFEDPPKSFAITENDLVIGGVGYVTFDDVHRFSAEVGYWLGEKYWGKGLATAALKWLADYIFLNTDIIRLFATTVVANKGSALVLSKAGFLLEGTLRSNFIKDGKTYDTFLFAKLKSYE